jgi:septal ring factor EnvC (AmiA/AmiB activator)
MRRWPRATVAAGIGWAVAIFCAAALHGQATSPPGDLPTRIEASNRDLAAIRTQIKQHRAQVEELAAEQKDASAQLKHLNQEMQLVQNLITELDEREAILTQQSLELQERLDAHQKIYAQRQAVTGRRLRSLYIQGPQRRLQVILASRSFSSLITRLRFATLMARLDSRLIEGIRQEGLSILAERQDLQAALAGIWEAREEAHQQRARLEIMNTEHQAILGELQQQKRTAEKQLTDLRSNEQALSDLLARLERQRQRREGVVGSAQGALSAAAGGWEWPATGEVVQSFGRSVHPDFKTVTLNNGITIASAVGAPVYAAEAGQVEFGDRLPGFGRCIIVEHGAGTYTLYGNLGRLLFARGDQVSRGEIIAEVGEPEGDGGAQLYFEIREGKTPRDPLEWLKPRR